MEGGKPAQLCQLSSLGGGFNESGRQSGFFMIHSNFCIGLAGHIKGRLRSCLREWFLENTAGDEPRVGHVERG